MPAHGQTKVSSLTSFTLGAGLALAASVTATASCASGTSSTPGASGASTQGSANGHSGATVSAPADSTTTATASVPNITVQRTGGFAGAKDTVDLAPHGSWTATDKSGTRRTGELTPDQATRITTLAADPRLTTEAARSRPPTRCRDAYSYVLTVGAVRVAFVDCPADPDQPAASLTLTKQVLRFTIQPAR
ncbi:hypothetical protein [Catenulispora pinisilvae]|uniref:hypothetical protein n=1 Tax=Catenulispora pinisilvae TaxID=2705253 RepID=UPI00189241FB|nr:hypothetical protein [Catenulispora pinisilvae]